MDIETMFQVLGTLAVSVRTAVEVIKATVLNQFELEESIHRAVVVILTILVSAVAVLGSGESLNVLSLFPGFANFNPLFGQILTILVIAGGSNLVHEFIEFVRSLRRDQQPAPVPSVVSNTVNVEKAE